MHAAEPNPPSLNPIHKTLHVSPPPIYSTTRNYTPVQGSDFVAVASDRFAAVSDALNPIDCTLRPSSCQLYLPFSPFHQQQSQYRHLHPTPNDVGVLVNKSLHPFLFVSPAHPTDYENNIITNQGIDLYFAVSLGLQDRLCTHLCCWCLLTSRVSVTFSIVANGFFWCIGLCRIVFKCYKTMSWVS